MIGQRPAWDGPHFQELVAHFSLFEHGERERLARMYQAASEEPRALAMSVCVDPSRLHYLLGYHAISEQAEELLGSLLLEHGAPVHVNAGGGHIDVLLELRDLGLLVWTRPIDTREPIPVTCPGIFAAAFDHFGPPQRPSFFLLSNLIDDDELSELAQRHGVASGPRLVMIIELAQTFADERFMERFLPSLEDPDHVGPAITALELGGMCYWQDVFGFDDDDEPEPATGEAKILPLMRDGAMQSQKEMAARLLDAGIIYKFELPETEFSMLAVPEELWLNLWVLARDWIMGWFEHTYGDLRDASISLRDLDGAWQNHSPTRFKQRMMWICAIALQPGSLEQLSERMAAQCDHDQDTCMMWAELALRLGLLRERAGDVHTSEQAPALLARSGRELAREMLSIWSVGHSTPRLERCLGHAIGLDETWRVQARTLLVEVLSEQGELEMLSAWLDSEGVEHDMTGMGYLRDLDERFDELLLAEFSVTNSIINYTRMLWLDVLSTLDEDQWYAQGKLGELMQFALALSLFHHLAHLFEHPELSQYIPVQRPDYLTLPVHTDALLEWSDVLVEELLVPLGLALVSEGRVRIRARALRIEGPPEMTHEFRERFMHTLLGLESFPLDAGATTSSGFGLRVLSAVQDAPDASRGEVALSSWDEILARLETEQIVGYDEAASKLVLAPR